MKMTKTIKVGILLAALLVVSCLLFLFGKFPVMMLNGEVCTVAADAAAAIVVTADSEKADTWIEDSSIAMTYMMLAAEEQNLGCCWVQIHLRTDADGRDAEENVREILGLPERFRVVGFLALGNVES